MSPCQPTLYWNTYSHAARTTASCDYFSVWPMWSGLMVVCGSAWWRRIRQLREYWARHCMLGISNTQTFQRKALLTTVEEKDLALVDYWDATIVGWVSLNRYNIRESGMLPGWRVEP